MDMFEPVPERTPSGASVRGEDGEKESVLMRRSVTLLATIALRMGLMAAPAAADRPDQSFDSVTFDFDDP
jgi:hypothetical protein